MKRKGKFSIPSSSMRHSEDPMVGEPDETHPPSERIEGGSYMDDTQATGPSQKKKVVRGPSKAKQLKDGNKLPEPKLLTHTFHPDSVKTQASVAIKSCIPQAHLSWTEWTEVQITKAWNTFQALYTWTDDNLDKSKVVFYNYANINYRKWLERARNESLKFDNPREHPPSYMSMDIWQKFWDEWDKPEYKIIQKKHKANRGSENVILHTSGSHSFEQVRLELAKDGNPEDVDPIELFEVTHKSKNGNYPTQKAHNIVEDAKEKRQELEDMQKTQISEGLTPQPIDLILDCLAPAAGGIKKGTLVGFPREKFGRKGRGEGSSFARATFLTREQHEASLRAQKEEYEEKIQEALLVQKLEYEDKIRVAIEAQKEENQAILHAALRDQKAELTEQMNSMKDMLKNFITSHKG